VIQGFLSALDGLFQDFVVAPISSVLFFDLAFWDNGQADEIQLPIVVVWLSCAALFFTLRFRFVNLRGFRHGLDVLRGRYPPHSPPRSASATSRASPSRSAWAGPAPCSGWCWPASSA
jgi:AGCS family alanine or glycine:cation symporter